MSIMGGDRWYEDAPKKKPKPKPKKPSPQAQAWAAPRTIFVPPAFTKPAPKPKPTPLPRYDPGATAAPRTAKQQRKDELFGMVKEATDRRRSALGLQAPAPRPNVADAVPTYHTPAQRRLLEVINERNVEWSQMNNPLAAANAKKQLVHRSDLPPAEKAQLIGDINDRLHDPGVSLGHVARGLWDEFGKLTTTPQSAIVTGHPMTPAEAEANMESILGKAPTNLILHGDAPNSFKDAAGLGIGIAGVLPFGKISKVGEELALAARTAKGAREYEAWKLAAREHVPEMAQVRTDVGKEIGRKERQLAVKKGDKVITDPAVRAQLEQEIESLQSYHDGLGRTIARASEEPNKLIRTIGKRDTDANLKQFINPRNLKKGAAENRVTLSAGAEGGGHQVVGELTPEAYTARLDHILESAPEVVSGKLTKEELGLRLGYWYRELGPMFQTFFGEDADAILRGFAVSQANASPSGGLLNVLRVRDRLLRGEHIGSDEISTVVDSIKAAYRGEHVSDGMQAKLHDFADSLEGKTTRTWTADNIAGGSPTAIDIHAQRDLGRIDPKILHTLRERHGLPVAHLQLEVQNRELRRLIGAKGAATKEGRAAIREQRAKIKAFKDENAGAILEGKKSGLKLDNPQASATGNAYNYALREYAAVTNHFNEIHYLGKGDWTPAEVQALGWSGIQRFHGVPPEDAMIAIDRNTHLISFEPTSQSELGYRDAMALTKDQEDRIRQIVSEEHGIWRNVEYGPSGQGEALTPSVQLHVIGSPEQSDRIAQRFADEFGNIEVTATRPGVVNSRKWGRSRFAIEIESPTFTSKTQMEGFWKALQKALPEKWRSNMERFDPYSFTHPDTGKQVFGMRIVTSHGYVPLKNTEDVQAVLSRYEGAIGAASDEVGIDVTHGANTVEIKEFRGNNAEGSVSGEPSGEPATDHLASEAAGQGVLSRLGLDEAGQLTPAGLRADPTLERTLQINELRQPMPGSRSGATRALIERPADAISQAMMGEGRVASAARATPGLRHASAMQRAMKQGGRMRAQAARAAWGPMRRPASHLPPENSIEDVAHFYYRQLPRRYQNAHGLQLVRDLQQETLNGLEDGSYVKLLLTKKRLLQQELKTASLPQEDGIRSQIRSVERRLSDVQPQAENLRLKLARLDEVIKADPPRDPKILAAMNRFASEREKLLGVDNEDIKGFLADHLGIEFAPDEEKVFVGHRRPKPQAGSRPTLLPGGTVGTGAVRSPAELKHRRVGTLLNQARLRDSTHVVVGDWQAAQTFANNTAIRDTFAKVGEPFVYGKLHDGDLLVNPKAHVVPSAWKDDPEGILANASEDPDGLLAAAKEIQGQYLAGNGATLEARQAEVDAMLAEATRNGVDYSDLRVIKKADAERFFEQFKTPGGTGPAMSLYDGAVDAAVASIVFARLGYIPKNTIANMLLVTLHQGAYLATNLPRAAELYRNTELRHLLEPWAGAGGIAELREEAKYGRGVKGKTKGAGAKVARAPGALAGFMGAVADTPWRLSALLHEAAAEGVIKKYSMHLDDEDQANLARVFGDPNNPQAHRISSRSEEAMVDFTRLTPTQKRNARRLFVIPSWLWSGSRYPVHFAATHPGRAAAIGYVAAGEPGSPFQNQDIPLPGGHRLPNNISDALHGKGFTQGIDTPIGRFRTQSLDPVSTPIGLGEAALNTARGGVNPFSVDNTLWSQANPVFRAGQGWAAGGGFGALESLAPSLSFAKGMAHPKASKYYPDDATRLGRLKRELGVFPIGVNDVDKSGPTDEWIKNVKEGKDTAYSVEAKILDRHHNSLVGQGKLDEAFVYGMVANDVHAGINNIAGYQQQGVDGLNQLIIEGNISRSAHGMSQLPMVTAEQYAEVTKAALDAKKQVHDALH